MGHSKNLEETALWKAYRQKIDPDSARGGWVKEVYEAAVNYMSDVRRKFQNYTLHDGLHIINVLDAMGGLLGNQISQLTAGETELLILAASLHDLGMVYTEEEEKRHYEDGEACRKFLREYCPELLGCPAEDWTEETCQWYLRTLHPFRIPEVLQNGGWKELFSRCPMEAVPKRCILAVCKAHGEKPEELIRNRDLKYLPANDVDPLFCALLLRLSDLLDFDDTRAPKILYGYVACNGKSRAEWDKHQASAGFCYPPSPSANDLPYKARCTDPGVEHAVRDFLDWVDEELGNCIRLQRYCEAGWQRDFPFPRGVLREEIESDGYMSGDFCLTMDQTQVLRLLAGENLYFKVDVFVRELLQNAIDATLLRGEMEEEFIPEQSRIDVWEWSDKEGNIWFRMDDQGTGMTLGMLQRYFLKVGNSYYNSREMERDLRDHGRTEKYQGISRFGIGFLSCFLCGDYAEVSTLYFDPRKNRREEAAAESYQTVHYGLRLQVTGLRGYYTLKSQAEHHPAEEPMPGTSDVSLQHVQERDGYRAGAGTSVAVRLNPGKLGTVNLREALEDYLCGARVPVYYNNERIGRTYGEVMQEAHELAGERFYELPDKLKEQFDQRFPAVRGQYPKVVMTVVPLDTGEDHILPGVSGVLAKYEVRFDKFPEWEVEGHKYMVEGRIGSKRNPLQGYLRSGRADMESRRPLRWITLENHFSRDAVEALAAEFDKYSESPQQEEQLGGSWLPFAGNISIDEAWGAYRDYRQEATMDFSLEECGGLNMAFLVSNRHCKDFVCAYQGVVAGKKERPDHYLLHQFEWVLFLEKEWRPATGISRSEIAELPLPVWVTVSAILNKHQLLRHIWIKSGYDDGWRGRTLGKWRLVRTPHFKQWMERNQGDYFRDRIQFLKEPWAFGYKEMSYFEYLRYGSYYVVLNEYQDAYLQDYYEMTINYEEGQTITFDRKEKAEPENNLDLFPPIRFCKAATDRSRRYICNSEPQQRKGITTDHPFVLWLIDNAVLLNQYYRIQFFQIIDSLYKRTAESIIKLCNSIRQQLISLPERHGIDVNHFPELSMGDFWSGEDGAK